MEYSGRIFNPKKKFSFYVRGKVTSTTQNVKVKGYDLQSTLLSDNHLVVTDR